MVFYPIIAPRWPQLPLLCYWPVTHTAILFIHPWHSPCRTSPEDQSQAVSAANVRRVTVTFCDIRPCILTKSVQSGRWTSVAAVRANTQCWCKLNGRLNTVTSCCSKGYSWVGEHCLTFHSTCNTHFQYESFLAIDCTGTDNVTQRTTLHMKKVSVIYNDSTYLFPRTFTKQHYFKSIYRHNAKKHRMSSFHDCRPEAQVRMNF